MAADQSEEASGSALVAAASAHEDDVQPSTNESPNVDSSSSQGCSEGSGGPPAEKRQRMSGGDASTLAEQLDDLQRWIQGGSSSLLAGLRAKAKNCHEEVKSSAAAGESRGNLCPRHQRGPLFKPIRVSVACQTEEGSLKATTSSAEPSPSGSSAIVSEGILKLTINDFKNMGDTVRGPCKLIQGINWRIMVMPRQHVVQKKGTQKCLGFFLQCCPDSYSDAWSCQATAELRLLSQKPGVANFTRKTNHVYTAKENDWGYSCFMTWMVRSEIIENLFVQDILDDNQGYILDDRVTLEVAVKAEPPKNILCYEEFRKQIQSWYDLADMQYRRNMIDLAIEANAQALKFCKDRDDTCKAQLEQQKEFLIMQKLAQSIKRIEEAPSAPQTDDSQAQTHALKLALTAQKMTAIARTQLKPGSQVKGKAKARTTTSPSKQKAAVNAPVETATAEAVQQMKEEGDDGREASPSSSKLFGRFNPLFDQKNRSQLPTAWRTLRIEPDLFSKLVREIEEMLRNLDLSSNNDAREAFIQRYVDDRVNEFALIEGILPADIRQNEKRMDEVQYEAMRVYDDTAMRMDILKETDRDVEEFLAKKPWDKASDEAFEEIEEMNFASLFEEGHAEERLSIIDSYIHYAEPFARFHIIWLVSARFFAESAQDLEASANNTRHSSFECDACIQERFELMRLAGANNEVAIQTDTLPEKSKLLVPQAKEADSPPHTVITPAKTRAAKKGTNRVPVLMRQPRSTPVNDVTRQAMEEIADSPASPDPSPPASPQAIKKATPPASGQRKAKVRRAKVEGGRGEEDEEARRRAEASPVATIPQRVPMEYAMRFFGEDAAAKEDENVFDALYVENWLKANLRLCWEHMKRSDEAAMRMLPLNPDTYKIASAELLEQQMQAHQNMAALSVITVNCVNARRLVDKVLDMMRLLETREVNKELRDAIRILNVLAGVPPYNNDCYDVARQNLVQELEAEDKSSSDGSIEDKDYAFIYSGALVREDKHDYLLMKELRRLDKVRHFIDMHCFVMHPEDVKQIIKNTLAIEDSLKNVSDEMDKQKKATDKAKEQLKQLEDRLQKEIRTLKEQLKTEKEKGEKVNVQLKDRKNEIKKLEKKARELATLTTEHQDLQEKFEQQTKELTAVQKRLNDEQNKHKKEMANQQEARKNIQAELANKDAEIARLHALLDDSRGQVKKLEQQVTSDRKSANANVNTAAERAKKAEITLLQERLDFGLSKLERAKEDAIKRAKEYEDAVKRLRNPAEVEQIRKAQTEWQDKTNEIVALINQSRTEFNAQIEAIRNGKHLSNLPRIAVPKPPPAAKLYKIPTAPTQPPVVVQPVASVAPLAPQAVAAPPHLAEAMSVTPRLPVQNNPGVIGSRNTLPTPIGPATINPQSRAPGSPIQKPTSPVRTHGPGPIGSRPSTAMQQNLQKTSAATNTSNPTPSPAQNGWPWGEAFAIADSLLPNLSKMSFGPLTGEFDSTDVLREPPPSSTVNRDFRNEPPPQREMSRAPGPPPTNSNNNPAAGWMDSNETNKGWNSMVGIGNGLMSAGQSSSSSSSVSNFTTMPPPLPQNFSSSQNSWNDPYNDRSRSRAPEPPQPLPQQTSNQSHVIIERLQTIFPQISVEKIIEFANEFFSQSKVPLREMTPDMAIHCIQTYISRKAGMLKHIPGAAPGYALAGSSLLEEARAPQPPPHSPYFHGGSHSHNGLDSQRAHHDKWSNGI